MQKKYMKQVGHADVQMFFYVDSAVNLAGKDWRWTYGYDRRALLPLYSQKRLKTIHQGQYGCFWPVLYGEDDLFEFIVFSLYTNTIAEGILMLEKENLTPFQIQLLLYYLTAESVKAYGNGFSQKPECE